MAVLLVRFGVGNKKYMTSLGMRGTGQKCLHGEYFRILSRIHPFLSSFFPSTDSPICPSVLPTILTINNIGLTMDQALEIQR